MLCGDGDAPSDASSYLCEGTCRCLTLACSGDLPTLQRSIGLVDRGQQGSQNTHPAGGPSARCALCQAQRPAAAHPGSPPGCTRPRGRPALPTRVAAAAAARGPPRLPRAQATRGPAPAQAARRASVPIWGPAAAASPPRLRSRTLQLKDAPDMQQFANVLRPVYLDKELASVEQGTQKKIACALCACARTLMLAQSVSKTARERSGTDGDHTPVCALHKQQVCMTRIRRRAAGQARGQAPRPPTCAARPVSQLCENRRSLGQRRGWAVTTGTRLRRLRGGSQCPG